MSSQNYGNGLYIIHSVDENGAKYAVFGKLSMHTITLPLMTSIASSCLSIINIVIIYNFVNPLFFING